jgi:hypothetical protein
MSEVCAREDVEWLTFFWCFFVRDQDTRFVRRKSAVGESKRRREEL